MIPKIKKDAGDYIVLAYSGQDAMLVLFQSESLGEALPHFYSGPEPRAIVKLVRICLNEVTP